jgi:hypothetical protein
MTFEASSLVDWLATLLLPESILLPTFLLLLASMVKLPYCSMFMYPLLLLLTVPDVIAAVGVPSVLTVVKVPAAVVDVPAGVPAVARGLSAVAAIPCASGVYTASGIPAVGIPAVWRSRYCRRPYCGKHSIPPSINGVFTGSGNLAQLLLVSPEAVRQEREISNAGR